MRGTRLRPHATAAERHRMMEVVVEGHRKRAENPFYNLTHSILPEVPPSREWAYKWVRRSIGGVADRDNMHASFVANPHLQWDIVDPKEMPELAHYAQDKSKEFPAAIVIRDVVLCRAPRQMVELLQEANQLKADDLESAVRADMEEHLTGDPRFYREGFQIEQSGKRMVDNPNL